MHIGKNEKTTIIAIISNLPNPLPDIKGEELLHQTRTRCYPTQLNGLKNKQTKK